MTNPIKNYLEYQIEETKRLVEILSKEKYKELELEYRIPELEEELVVLQFLYDNLEDSINFDYEISIRLEET